MQLSKSVRRSLALLQLPLRSNSLHVGVNTGMRSRVLNPFFSTDLRLKSFRTYATNEQFTPPVPPKFNGQAVFPNIPLNGAISSDADKRNNDADAVFVVTGASRGIGLQILKDLATRTKGTIVACCRAPKEADHLHSFIKSLPTNESRRILLKSLDLEEQETIETLGKEIEDSHKRVDVLYNVAGILGDGKNTPGPERSLRSLDRNWAMKSMNVNYIGPVSLSQVLAPMMRSTLKKDDRGKSVIVNLSARVGSISDNGLGGWISYRSSKAALNQANRTMAHELKRQGTLCICLHPGTTDTGLSKPFQGNVKKERLFPVEFTASRMIDAVDCMDELNTGGLYDWSGTALPF
uniref:Protochlorophyllide reductase n=1 Tax=Chaetoceros debilis TaxID=122233 RepID=A0A7S3PXF5_9STRA|mmetsp:Transcript_10072/g.15189  ORF Transcript_10072/g.15189 Transcript_10072/m.15189 type:complete len:350 (+) Transcript_10072:131-1180(+)|eukprot:CAMPEP_0194091124 /NCGR_PEP_ID=MMETSP0149-20130528/41702_1 /TAXON_ID=122233 /ORGANISM="Chaetoceros debilis, Strain MM31A-1" /LENGTH=349 /DNA_ID=CAMNT_0038775601 /DNA_START=82 /DNA_END=1131 /DNA_ORIENTATION=-